MLNAVSFALWLSAELGKLNLQKNLGFEPKAC